MMIEESRIRLGVDHSDPVGSSGRIAVMHHVGEKNEGKELRLVALGVYCLTGANL